jgi:hypothetical protein
MLLCGPELAVGMSECAASTTALSGTGYQAINKTDILHVYHVRSADGLLNLFGTGIWHLNFSTPVCKMQIIHEPKKGTIMK